MQRPILILVCWQCSKELGTLEVLLGEQGYTGRSLALLLEKHIHQEPTCPWSAQHIAWSAQHTTEKTV